MKAVVLDAVTVNPGDLSWEPFEALGNVKIYDNTKEDEVVSRIGDAQAVVVNRISLTREQLEQCPQLKYIGVFATGYNLIDWKAARELGISVANVPAYSTDAVAQAVFAFLLTLSNDILGQDALVKQGEWEKPGGFDYSLTRTFELGGKTIGLIGMGNIGRKVAQLASCFGMNVLFWCRHPDPAWESEAIHSAPFDRVLSESHIISLHVPLTPETRHLIDQKAVSRMREGVIFINTARGGVVDQEALLQGLDSGKISRACIDVLEEEPPKPGNPLIHHPRCIATPHVAWAPAETRARVIRIAADNLASFFKGMPVNIVN